MSRDGNRPRVIVAIDTDEGITGWGECYNHGPDRALPPLLDHLYLQIEGQDPRRIEALIQKLLQQSRFPPGAMGPMTPCPHPMRAIRPLQECALPIKTVLRSRPFWPPAADTLRHLTCAVRP